MATNITQLVSRIRDARKAYTNGVPIMSDAQYDALEDTLRKFDPNHPALKKVGAPVPGGGWAKVKHAIPMGSQFKAQDDNDLAAWLTSRGYTDGEGLCVTEKADGISLGMKFVNRKLVQALTRGDGETGEDITRNVLLMQGAVKMLPPTMGGQPTPNTVYVRAEIVCTHSDFKAQFVGESNPRNTAAGTAKRQSDPSKCAHLTVICYQLLPEGRATMDKAEELKALTDAGFYAVRWTVCTTAQEIRDTYTEYVDTIRESLNYDIDGLIVEFNDRARREALGEHDNRPKGAIAWKFPHEEKQTTLRNIRWQVGRSGRVTPVADFDTVNFVGANVKQASLHNISNIADLASAVGQQVLAEGDKILVSRRNDVIPFVEAVIEGTEDDNVKVFEPPTQCPVCGAKLERDGEYLVCRNTAVCPAQVTGMMERWTDKIGVLHVGDTFISAMVEAFPFNLTDDVFKARYDKKITDLTPTERSQVGSPDYPYNLPEDEFVARFGKKQEDLSVEERANVDAVQAAQTMDIADLYLLDPDKAAEVEYNGRRLGGSATKAIRNLHAKTSLPLHVMVGALGIPMIGRSMAKIIIDGGFGTLAALYKARISEVAAIPKVGATKADSFVRGFKDKIGLVTKLVSEAGITVKDSNGPLVGMSFCVTGFRDATLDAAIESAGGTMKSSVSKALTYLVQKDPTQVTGKAAKAAQYGIKVIGVDEARKLAGL